MPNLLLRYITNYCFRGSRVIISDVVAFRMIETIVVPPVADPIIVLVVPGRIVSAVANTYKLLSSSRAN